MQTRSKSEAHSTSESRDFPPDFQKVEEMARRGSSALKQKIKERPLWCAGIAAGAGFVLGGGLASPAALRVLRKSVGLVLQLTVMPAIVSRLQDALGDMTTQADESSPH